MGYWRVNYRLLVMYVQFSLSLRDALPEGMAKSLQDLQEDILGSEELMDAEKARKVDGVWCGGIHWERSDYAVNIATSERCYTVAQSYQIQRNLTSPAVGAKVYGDRTTHHDLRKKVIQVCRCVCTLVGLRAHYIGTDRRTCSRCQSPARPSRLFSSDAGSSGGQQPASYRRRGQRRITDHAVEHRGDQVARCARRYASPITKPPSPYQRPVLQPLNSLATLVSSPASTSTSTTRRAVTHA